MASPIGSLLAAMFAQTIMPFSAMVLIFANSNFKETIFGIKGYYNGLQRKIFIKINFK